MKFLLLLFGFVFFFFVLWWFFFNLDNYELTWKIWSTDAFKKIGLVLHTFASQAICIKEPTYWKLPRRGFFIN